MLDWHYQYVIYDEGGPFLIRQHASALLNAIYSGTTVDAVPILGEKIAMCSCKWFYEATKLGITEVFIVCKTFLFIHFGGGDFAVNNIITKITTDE